MTEHLIQVELDGIISLLARNLYPNPDLFLRELIQNAHDSVVRRRLEGPAPPGAIRLRAHAADRTLAVEDNGSGLTEPEIHAFLSTIGRSGTRELRERLADPAMAASLIGQFGIGLLSAFLVAGRVEVTTRAAGHEALRWTSDGGRTYTLEPASRSAVGTTVLLHLQRDAARYTDPGKLALVVRTWADFVGVPVFLGDDGEPVNAVDAPWSRPGASDACREWWLTRHAPLRALDVLAVEGDGVRGALGVPADRVAGALAGGSLDVYVRRMLVARGLTDALPEWARFVRGTVQCDALAPTASRDDVVRDASFAHMKEALAGALRAYLRRLVGEPAFDAIAAVHGRALMEACQADPDFHAMAWDRIPVPATTGPLPLARLLARPDGGPALLHLLVEPDGAEQARLLCAACGLEVVDASDPVVERFLALTTERWPDRLVTERISLTGSPVFFRAPADPAAWRALEALAARALGEVTTRVSHFEPADLPAVLLESRPQRTRRELGELCARQAVPRALQAAVDGYLAQAGELPVLVLNAAHPLVGRLRETPERAPRVLAILHDQARHLLRQVLTAAELRAATHRLATVLEAALEAP